MNAYKKLDLEQGTESWKKVRMEKLTASQAPTLFGLNPHETLLELAEQKIYGIEKKITESQQILFDRGHSAERAGREWIEKNMGLLIPPVVLLSNTCPDLMASLDGFDESKGIIFEGKFVGKEKLKDVKNGKIQAHHECQVQAQLLVSGAEKCIYFATDPDGDSAVFEIAPDKEYGANIAREASQFMENVRFGKLPEPSDRDFVPIDDPRFSELRVLKEQMDVADAASKIATLAFEEMKAKVLGDYSSVARIKAAGLMIYKIFYKGNVQYDKIPQLKGVDKDKYRAAGSFRTTVKLDKKGA